MLVFFSPWGLTWILCVCVCDVCMLEFLFDCYVTSAVRRIRSGNQMCVWACWYLHDKITFTCTFRTVSFFNTLDITIVMFLDTFTSAVFSRADVSVRHCCVGIESNNYLIYVYEKNKKQKKSSTSTDVHVRFCVWFNTNNNFPQCLYCIE